MEVDLTNVLFSVISGLFSISMISITVFALLNKNLEGKILGLRYISLKRYSVLALFFPLIILVIELLIITSVPTIINFQWTSFIVAFPVILYLIIHAYFVLQPLYDEEKFKNSMIKKRFHKERELKDTKSSKKLKLSNKKRIKTSKEIMEELTDLKEKYLNRENENIVYTYDDIKNIWIKYIDEINNLKISNDDFGIFMNLGFKLFGDDFYSLARGIKDNQYIDYIIEYKLKENDKKAFDELFTIFHSAVHDQSFYSKNDDNKHYLLRKFLLAISDSIKLQQYLMNIIAEKEWNKKDALYIRYYIKFLLLKKEEILKSESIPLKIDYMYKCYENDKNFDESFGRNYDSLLKTCFKLIKEDMDDEK